MKNSEDVEIYTDGACSGNPGPGGWAGLLIYGNHKKLISSGFRLTTNNRMEIVAVIESLKSLKKPCGVVIKTDSKLIVDAFQKGWIDNWLSNNWKKGPRLKDPVKNKDLWNELYSLTQIHSVKFMWIKAHSGIEGNEIVDKKAVEESLKNDLPIDEVYELENT